MFPDSIVKKVGDKEGKTLAVFAGIHGNEKAGVRALNNLLPKIKIDSGTVYFVYANPPAIEKGVRYVNKNLNRLFLKEVSGDEYEVKRAHELMDILDECDALLDLHSYNSPEGEAFAITESNGYDFVSRINVPLVASGFGDLGYGSDDYMFRSGKIGVCVECGTSNNYEVFTPFAERVIKQFIGYFGAVDAGVSYDASKQQFFKVNRLLKKQTEAFRFTREFRDFELLPTDEPFIIDGDAALTASVNEAIVFPRAEVPLSEEVCIIGEFFEK